MSRDESLERSNVTGHLLVIVIEKYQGLDYNVRSRKIRIMKLYFD